MGQFITDGLDGLAIVPSDDRGSPVWRHCLISAGNRQCSANYLQTTLSRTGELAVIPWARYRPRASGSSGSTRRRRRIFHRATTGSCRWAALIGTVAGRDQARDRQWRSSVACSVMEACPVIHPGDAGSKNEPSKRVFHDGGRIHHHFGKARRTEKPVVVRSGSISVRAQRMLGLATPLKLKGSRMITATTFRGQRVALFGLGAQVSQTRESRWRPAVPRSSPGTTIRPRSRRSARRD